MSAKARMIAINLLLGLTLCVAGQAQVPPPNLPSANGYRPIPNFSGDSAGLQFREAINDRLSGVQTIAPRMVSLTFASLGAEQNGALIYCSDCKQTIPCVGGGSGALAFGTQGQWECTAPGTAPQGGAAQFTSIAGSGSGASVSGMVLNGVRDLTAYGGKCDGATDNTPAWNAARAAGVLIRVPPGFCIFSQPIVFDNINEALMGAGSNQTIVGIRGSDSGACTNGANGAVQMFFAGDSLARVTVSLQGPTSITNVHCGVNVSNSSSGGIVASLDDVTIQTNGNYAETSEPALALLTANTTNLHWHKGIISSSQFQQGWVANGPQTAFDVSDVTILPMARDFAAGVFYDSNWQAQFNGCASGRIGLIMEGGPNGVLFDATNGGAQGSTCGGLDLHLWTGDRTLSCTPMLANTSYAEGSCVIPSTTTTLAANASAGATSLQLGSTAGLYPTMTLRIAGAGSGGVALDDYVTAVSGNTVTLLNGIQAAISTGAQVAWENTNDFIYAATIAGTSGAQPVSWPTTPGSSVVSGTATFRWYGYGAFAGINQLGVHLHGSSLGAGAAEHIWAGPGAAGIDISGNDIHSPGYLGGILCDGCQVHLEGNDVYGAGELIRTRGATASPMVTAMGNLSTATAIGVYADGGGNQSRGFLIDPIGDLLGGPCGGTFPCQTWGYKGTNGRVYLGSTVATGLPPVQANDVEVEGSCIGCVSQNTAKFLDTSIRHLVALYGDIPGTPTACGTNPSISDGHSTDTAFEVTTGAGATTCTVPFAEAYANPPMCFPIDETSKVALQIVAPRSTSSVTFTGFNAGDHVLVHCDGK